MKDAIEGPNCTDPILCNGGCCSIKIDIPKILAEEYIKRGYATKDDFTRSNIFSFQLRFNEVTTKCFLFDEQLNGCSVHNSGIKPAQCWIYPTNFSNSEGSTISCKNLSGWKIISPNKAREAEDLFTIYNFLCQLEARKELKNMRFRLSGLNPYNVSDLKALLKKISPSELAGFVDKWNSIGLLSANGKSFQMKKFCLRYNKSCIYLPEDYFECQNICDHIAGKLYEYMKTENPLNYKP